MYKIVFLQTGNVFELPEATAKSLKENFPDDYEILAPNAKKKTKKATKVTKNTEKQDPNSILEKVKERG